MNPGFALMFVLWLGLWFTIPAAVYALYKETREPTVCSPLIVSLLVIIGCLGVAFYTFSKDCFPVVRALFL
jgi:hypothetical protein